MWNKIGIYDSLRNGSLMVVEIIIRLLGRFNWQENMAGRNSNMNDIWIIITIWTYK